MNPIEEYLSDLASALRVRGPRRRRFLAECRDHLTDASQTHGPEEAVRRFGPVADLMRGFEEEVAVRRGRGATVLSAAGVLGAGASTLMMVNAADVGATAPLAWAVVFFASAQTAAVATFLALIRVIAMRHESATASDVLLLCRRSWIALGSALVTMFAAGAGVTGKTDAWRVLIGPAMIALASIALVSVGRLARRHEHRRARLVRPPLVDLAGIAHLSDILGSNWIARPSVILGPTVVAAAAAAFWWNHLDHGSAAGSSAAAGIEATCALAGFLLLGPSLGLFATRRNPGPNEIQ